MSCSLNLLSFHYCIFLSIGFKEMFPTKKGYPFPLQQTVSARSSIIAIHL